MRRFGATRCFSSSHLRSSALETCSLGSSASERVPVGQFEGFPLSKATAPPLRHVLLVALLAYVSLKLVGAVSSEQTFLLENQLLLLHAADVAGAERSQCCDASIWPTLSERQGRRRVIRNEAAVQRLETCRFSGLVKLVNMNTRTVQRLVVLPKTHRPRRCEAR